MKIFKHILLFLLLQSIVLAQKSDIGEFLSFDTIMLLVGLLSPVFTRWAKRIFRTKGNMTLLVNIILNMIVKGAFLFITGEATLLYAIMWTVVGIVLDKGIYEAITEREKSEHS